MRNQPHEPGGTRPSYRPSGIPMWHGDADAPLPAEQQQAQAAAEAAALIKFGRDTAPSRALTRPSLLHVDVSWMTDDEINKWLDPEITLEQQDVDRLLLAILDGLEEVKEHRQAVWLNYLDDPSTPPNWDTAVVALLEGEGEG